MAISRFLARWTVRGVAAAGAAAVIVVAAAGMASAHVSVHSPDQPAKGGDAEIVFRVPDEQDSAGTVKVEVDFPPTTPIADADLKPVPGWTGEVTTTKLPQPVNMGTFSVDTAVQSIVWTAAPGTKINPGEFQEFAISVEGLPTNTDALVMPAVQTYDNGDVVKWDQQTVAGQAEPEHPAPSLTLAAAESGSGAAPAAPAAATSSSDTSDTTARWLGGVGIVLAILALGAAIGFGLGRRGKAEG
ncbi:MAG TPA: YcnI family protein [Amycolatopsis sp.]|nr:YcnI family protein [Amycolatopsis sp.]